MNIISKFLEKGYFIDKDVILNFSENELNFVLEKLEKTNIPKKITVEEIKKLLESEKFQIINLRKKGEFSIFEFSKILKERYEYFFSILSQKTLVPIYSINKLKNVKKYGIIGFVFEIREKEIDVEDLTGKVELKNEKNFKVWKDSCLLFICSDEYIEEVIYPEIDYKEFSSTLFVGYEKKLNIPSILFSSEVLNEKNTLKINFDFQDVFQVKFGNELIILIDSSKVDFEREKFQKTRLIITEAERILKYGRDMYLVKDKPSLIILANSDETKIIDEKPLTVKLKEKSNIMIKDKSVKVVY
jgi:hypothetical protein